MKNEKYCVIGCGGLGGALVRGILRHDRDQGLVVIDRHPEKIQAIESELGIEISSSDSIEAAADADVVLMAVKPHATTGLLENLSKLAGADTLFISVAAGLGLGALEVAAPRAAIARTMPNIGSAVAAGTTAVMLSKRAQPKRDGARLESIFGAVGQTRFLSKESEFHSATALAGSGPAFVLMMMETMEDAGVRCGLSRKDAGFFARGAFRAAVELLESTGLEPGQLKAQITSPGGTTIAGLAALERGGFRGSILDGVDAAEDRSQEMEKENAVTKQ
jgi:pyrroline-5-carboxylate reductase